MIKICYLKSLKLVKSITLKRTMCCYCQNIDVIGPFYFENELGQKSNFF